MIDLNRRVDDPTLVRRTAARTVLPWNDSIDAREIERRVLAYHTPYHVEIDRLILRRLVRGVRPVLLAVHLLPLYWERNGWDPLVWKGC